MKAEPMYLALVNEWKLHRAIVKPLMKASEAL